MESTTNAEPEESPFHPPNIVLALMAIGLVCIALIRHWGTYNWNTKLGVLGFFCSY